MDERIQDSAHIQRCLLLELPAELRMQIYEHVYNVPCSPQFFLRDDKSIQQPLHRWFSHEGIALLRTCSTIHREALSVVYNHATFRIQIYIGSGWPTYYTIGPLSSSNPLFARMQKAEITLHLVDAKHIDPAFFRLGLLAQAMEGAGGNLKSLRVTFKAVTSYNMEVTGDLVEEKVQEWLEQRVVRGVLGWDRAEGEVVRVEGLFRRMLEERIVVAVR